MIAACGVASNAVRRQPVQITVEHNHIHPKSPLKHFDIPVVIFPEIDEDVSILGW
jgi:hypothetical protein